MESDSAAATEAVGARIAAGLVAGDLVVVAGDVGAGKTTLIRGACRALGVQGPVTSPTFTIGQRYVGGRLPVSHLDLYRLGSVDPEEPGLLEDYLDPAGVAFVEWPEVSRGRLGRATLSVALEHAGEERRRVLVEAAPGPPGGAG